MDWWTVAIVNVPLLQTEMLAALLQDQQESFHMYNCMFVFLTWDSTDPQRFGAAGVTLKWSDPAVDSPASILHCNSTYEYILIYFVCIIPFQNTNRLFSFKLCFIPCNVVLAFELVCWYFLCTVHVLIIHNKPQLQVLHHKIHLSWYPVDGSHSNLSDSLKT